MTPAFAAAFLALAARSWLSHLGRLWAYVTLGATSIITEEAAPVVAGFAAHQHHLGVVQAAVACAVGSWAADIGLYFLGRWRAVRVVSRWPSMVRPMERLLGVVGRHPMRAACAVRFAYGARFLLPVTCGAARTPFAGYVIGSGVSAWSWSALFTALGWIFGETAVRVIGRVRRHEDAIALGLAVVIAIIVLFVQARNESRVPEELEEGLHLGVQASGNREP